ncbi:MAG: ferrous iron transporter B [Phycisphaeraceae bacterium]|nr:ferrous iron transporter B [Phycisphaeraceae bacterium]
MTQLSPFTSHEVADLLDEAQRVRGSLDRGFRDHLVESIYHDAAAIAGRVTRRGKAAGFDLDRVIDRIVLSPVLGLPLMLLLLGLIFWTTIIGANYPSQMLATGLFWIEAQAAAMFEAMGAPWWLTGFIWHGVYRGLAWVISVMLPPMAIFFPCFTILEDLGYLPRVAYNLDWLFKKSGGHGKQALTMSMGFGCNAAGVIACRVIDSPRERLIAILTNNFVPCNGRYPTLILIAMVIVGAGFAPTAASAIAAASVLMVVVIGVIATLLASALLSHTLLKGQASAFTLELPSYRRPNIGRIIYTSLIDRTIFVLLRAIATAAPAGAVIWLLGNIHAGASGGTLDQHVAGFLDPLGHLIGLDGVILLAYIIAIPANEIVVPTMLMVYMSTGMMTEDVSHDSLRQVLVEQHGWTMLTAINLMLFSLLHNPCATTIITMWKETRSLRWTALGAVGPLVVAFAVCFIVAQAAHLFGLG